VTPRRYTDLQVGDICPPEPARFEVTQAVVTAFRHATQDDAVDPSTAPSMLAAVYLIEVLQSRGSPPGGVHAKQSFKFHRRIAVGDMLLTSGTVTSKFLRKDRPYVTMSFETHDAQERLVASGLTTSVWGSAE